MRYPLSPPLLEMLILSIISREDSYGYQISQRLKSVSSMKDSALYPVLKRLSENGFVRVYDQQYQGRNRKYYQITDSGIEYCSILRKEWQDFTGGIQAVIDGEDALTGEEER